MFSKRFGAGDREKLHEGAMSSLWLWLRLWLRIWIWVWLWRCVWEILQPGRNVSGLGFLASDFWEMVQVELADSSDEGRAAAIEIEQLNNCKIAHSVIHS